MCMREQEVKAMLSVNQYTFLKNQFMFDDEFEQINSYYSDKNGIIDARNITIRVREKGNQFVLQVKERLSERGSLHISNEYEKQIYGVPRFIGSSELSELCGSYLPDVHLLDTLVTHRMVKWWNKTTQICLDKNNYLGQVDYEVEIEYKNILENEILSRFELWDILFDKEICGKYHRFKHAYNGCCD